MVNYVVGAGPEQLFFQERLEFCECEILLEEIEQAQSPALLKKIAEALTV